MAKLTEKQKRFADYYIELGNATEAYKRAYTNVTKQRTAESAGNRLLSNVEVKNYIDERLKQVDDKRIAKAEEVLEFLTRVLRGEETEETVVVEGIGEGMSRARKLEKDLSAKDRIKAAELLGKRYSIFTDKVDLQGNLGVTIVDDIGDDIE